MNTHSRRTTWVLLVLIIAVLSVMSPDKGNAAVLDLQVGATSDDGYEFGNTGQTVTSDPDENKIYSDTSPTSSNYRYGGFRWTNVTIPPGATITAAYISVYSSYGSGYDNLNVDIRFEAGDNPGTFVAGGSNFNISTRSRTAAFTPWVANLPVGAWYNSPSIVSVVQEIVNRGGWSSGNAMVAIFVPKTDSLKYFRCRAYENPTFPGFGAKLHIEYTTGKFLYRRQITIQDGMTPASCGVNLLDFPVLISFSNQTWLRTKANGGNVYNSSGYDIIFRASDGVNQLDHEVESYDGTTGTLVAWVRIPSLAYNADTTIYMYYGNGEITSSTANPTAVWDSSYVGVWHLKESSGTGYYLLNSKQNNYHANANSTVYLAGSIIDGGRDFNNSYCDVQNGGSLFNGDSAFTVELWAYPDYATDAAWVEETFLDSDSLHGCRWFRSGDSANTAHVQCDMNWADASLDYFSATSAITRQQWNHLVLTYDNATVRWFVNGAQVNTLAKGANTLAANSYLYFGSTGGINSNFDEYRYSRTARNACWIATEYNNRNSAVPSSSSGMMVKSGSYTGDGLNNKQITGLGFQPDIVIIKAGATYNPICSTSSMGGYAKDLGTTALALQSNLINSLDANGFKVGTDTRVNLSGTAYYWVAFKAGAGELKVGSYTGTGAAHGITGVGFQPEWVVVMSSAADLSRHRSASMTNTAFFSATPNATTGMTSLDADGFSVDTDATVNTIGTTYHYFAFNKTSGKMNEGTYTGNAVDNTAITGAGFQPEYVLVKSALANRAVAHPASLSGDFSLQFSPNANLANDIQVLQADGFQIGTTARVNTSTNTYYWMAFGPSGFTVLGSEESPAPTAVKLTSFTATAYDGGVLLRWKTGYEVDNLGFHIYREENGHLVRLTPEPVAGSALMAGSRTALTAGHHYHWWDSSLSPQSSALGTLKYWLKDIDLSGKETMHGPVPPVFSREPLPEKFRPELLSERGMRLQERYHHYWKVRELKEKLAEKPKAKVKVEVKGASRGHGLRSGNKVPLRIDPAGLEGRGFHRQPDLAANEVQRVLANRPAVKLFVREEGWYRVTQPELVAAGLSSKMNPRHLQLYVDGREQPIRVIGKRDGVFGPGDAIEFYGVGLDTPSTDTRVYWLIEGPRPGKRVELSHSQGGRIVSSSFPHTVQVKDRWIYLPAIKNGEEENFFGAVVYGSGVDQLLGVKHLDLAASEDALLEVVLQGATNTPHQVKVLLNNEEAGEVVFEGQSKGLFQVEVPQAFLREGDNLVSFIPLGGEMDVSLVDSIRLTYWHTYSADDNGLRLTAQGGSHLTVNGFTHPKIRVIDITDSNDVAEVFGKVESQKGVYAVSFRVLGTELRTLLALAEERVKSPEGITSNQPSSWHQVKDGYDLVMISHRDFLDSLQPLKKLRESQGLKVGLIDVEDLYDEFSFGNKTPKAIKDFLASAKSKWRRAPRFVLLVGDASFDPRNYFGLGDFDLVPTKLIDTQYLETASDDWFVDSNNDGLPEIAIGRLPVQTAEEAAIVVSKIVGYEKSGKKNEALLVADRSDNSDDFNFEGASEEIWGLLPSSLVVRKIYRSQFSSDSQANGVLLSAINQGPLLVNFIGHGSIEIWRGILTSDDAEGLVNGMRLPFFINMTCLNGYFQDPYSETLGEALLKAQGGGAIAIWTSSGLTEPDKQAVMNKELIRLLFNGQSLTLGDATAKAKKVVSDQDIRKTWILFGDPTTRLK